ncbi:hypothetical protein BZL29_3205 [Mycobacterium kansasii]|uniref:Uncharacterized protein n=1 Tax=Mycobacterium kansasii TaxID=1768 RepID=A0A1V3XEK4_MYCKA|nr:hypothetical protein BZL29_3205 [Mycobacterium kansasii]
MALLGGAGFGIDWHALCGGCARGGAGGVVVLGDVIGRVTRWASEAIMCAC